MNMAGLTVYLLPALMVSPFIAKTKKFTLLLIKK